MARHLGPAVVHALGDPDVTEIYRNPQDGYLRFDTRSGGRVCVDAVLDADRCEKFLNAVAASQGVTLGIDIPRIQAELPERLFGGSRLQGFVPPASAGPAFNIRKRALVIHTLDDYVEARVMTGDERTVLAQAVEAHWNILIAGGTNTGKTTLANAVLREITDRCPDERIVVLEDTAELQCAARDHLSLRTSATLSLGDLVKATLRASPNRIVVGEVRDREALDLLDAWATGHPGGCGTVHATTALGALERLDRLAQRASAHPQRALIAEAVNLVLVIAWQNGHRRVTELARVVGLDPRDRFILDSLTVH
jgi:type IV secretion system protein VirB11